MSTISFLRSIPGFDVLSSNIFLDLQDAPIISRSSTALVFSASDFQNDRISFLGSGFSYQLMGGEVVGVPTGTVTRVVYNNPTLGETYLDWTGLNVSANAFVTFVLSSNWAALNALLFNSSDTYNLTNGADAVRGFGGNDVMRGFSGNDRLFGDQGNDKLFGDAGGDLLNGGTGADTLMGGSGIDTLTGGAGADVFAFTFATAGSRDRITDFRAVDDALHFDNDAFTAFSYTGRLRAADFVTTANANDASDRFVYHKTTGNLWYDRDGSGGAAKVLVAELADGTTRTAADIFIL